MKAEFVQRILKTATTSASRICRASSSQKQSQMMKTTNLQVYNFHCKILEVQVCLSPQIAFCPIQSGIQCCKSIEKILYTVEGNIDSDPYIRCKDTIPKNLNKYYQKRNCAASVPTPLSTFKCLWAIHIYQWPVCLICYRKICGPILGIHTVNR